MVTSGVPQGSVLGPILFNIFINDITDSLQDHVTVKLFADDVKLYSELSVPTDVLNFQSYLDQIQTWAATWQIGISYSKCNTMELGPHPTRTEFFLSNSRIQTTSITKDLGVQFESNLKFKAHNNDIVNRAHQRAALIYRSFLSRDTYNLILAFKTYVRPLLEYVSPVWSPTHVMLIRSVEAVQRRFTKRLLGMDQLPYAERLTQLGLQSLEQRRLITDLILYYNIIPGHSSLTFSDFFSFTHNPSSRGHSLRISIPLVKTNIHKHFFSCRAVNCWNSLPDSVVTATSKSSFKRSLSKVNLQSYISQPWIMTQSVCRVYVIIPTPPVSGLYEQSSLGGGGRMVLNVFIKININLRRDKVFRHLSMAKGGG